MKTLIWLVLFLLGLTGVLVPAVYLRAASKLPTLESEYDVEIQLRHSIEGERMSLKAGTFERSGRPMDYKRPEFSRLPKDLVALYISQLGCPTYFQTPREDGLDWAWRLVMGLAGNGLPGDGACERFFALRLAGALGIEGALEQTVAAHRLHTFLQKDQLIAYDLSAVYFERGIVGVQDGAWRLLNRELDTLELAELAEFALVLPPYFFWEDGRQCRNPSLLRQNRDSLLAGLAGNTLVTEERARNAVAQPLACDR